MAVQQTPDDADQVPAATAAQGTICPHCSARLVTEHIAATAPVVCAQCWKSVTREQPAEGRRISKCAIASLVLGMMASVASLFAGLPAIVLGLLALRRIKRNKPPLAGRRLAISGIATGALFGLLCVPVHFALILPIGVSLRSPQRYRRLADAHRWAGELEAARKDYQREVDLRLGKSAADRSAGDWGQLGQALYRLGRLAEARQALEKSIRMRRETQPTAQGGARWWYLAMVLFQLGETEQARQYYDQLAAHPDGEQSPLQQEVADLLDVP